jgi:hypothetical protein
MSPKSIVAFAAAITIGLAATARAQTAADDAAAAQAYMLQKMKEATDADDKFHANRTQANMIARDKAEAEAAAAIQKAHAAQDNARAEAAAAKASTQGGAKAGGPK